MREAIAAYKKHKSKLLEQVSREIASESLKADQTIAELFSKATEIEVSVEILAKARRRLAVGNPPGKNNSLGDAINWECLLQAAPHAHDMCFITDDRDYSSALDVMEFSPFLQMEWAKLKKGKILYFSRLSAFLKNHFPEIRFAREDEKELLIGNLERSPDFVTTRKLLKQLVEYSEFTAAQLNDIAQAAITNNQVYWIAHDQDINEYLRKLIAGQEGKIEPTALKKLKDVMGEIEPTALKKLMDFLGESAPAAQAKADEQVPF